MQRLLLSGLVLAILTSSALAQDATLEGSAGVVSDYSHRGISRSDGAALQGRIKLNYDGAYGGLAASTVDMNLDPDANVEAVLFGGYKGTYDVIDYDLGLSYTSYPGGDNDDADYWEFTAIGGYDFGPFYGSLTWAASPSYINDSGMSLYYGADLEAPLTPVPNMDLTAKVHLGFLFVDDEANYVDDPMDWSVGLWYNWAEYDLDLGLQYLGTDADDDECSEECGSRAVFSLTKPFAW